MIGTRRVRSLPRISSASSKPFRPGICTSTSASATSCRSSSSSASSPERAFKQHEPVAAQQRFQRQQIFFQIVDQKKMNRAHAIAVMSFLSLADIPRSRASDKTRALGHSAIAASGIAEAYAPSGFCTIASPPASATAFRPSRPVLIGARQHDRRSDPGHRRRRRFRTARRWRGGNTAPAHRWKATDVLSASTSR